MVVATVPALALALALAVAAAAAFAWLWRRKAHESASLSSTRRRLESLADSVPGAWYAWFYDDGTEGASDNLAALLGLDAVPLRFADVAPALADEDYARIEEAIGTLRSTGEGFSILAQAPGERRLTFEGSVATTPGGDARAHVVWVRETPMLPVSGGAAVTGPAALLQQILDSLPDPVWRRNEDLDIVWWNRAFAEALGEDLEAPDGGALEFASRLFAPKARELAETARAQGRV
jgi:PAS domain-containing protein